MSAEWWIMLSGGGGDDDDRRSNASNGGGKSTAAANAIVFVSVAATSAIVIAAAFLLWRQRRGGGGRSPTIAAETAAMAPNGPAERGDRTGEKYSLLSRRLQQQQQQRNVYPNLSASDRDRDPGDPAGDPAPDIMIQQNYGKQFLVSIVNRGIPGPESCV